MQEQTQNETLPSRESARYRLKHRSQFDALAMFVYLCLVYGWGLTVQPLGGGIAHWGNLGADLPFGAREIVMLPARIAAPFPPPPVWLHALNALALYACMLCVYRLANYAIRGPVWLGTLAGTLFMANPAYNEAVLSQAGLGHLLPGLSALLALLAYQRLAHTGELRWWPVSLLLFAWAMLAYPINTWLFSVVILFELLIVPKEKRKLLRVLPIVALGGVGMLTHGTGITGAGLAERFVPLYFIFYSIGFLPESAHRYAEAPWQAWGAAVSAMAVVGLIAWKTRHRTVWYALAAMALLRLAPLPGPVEPVHLTGGGQLLLPAAFFYIGLCKVFHRCMEHPKWKRPVVSGTTLLCIIFFGIQIHAITAWRQAGDWVAALQSTTWKLSGDVALLPDLRNYRGAPARFADALGQPGMPGAEVRPRPIAALDARRPLRGVFDVETYTQEQAVFSVRGLTVNEAFPPGTGLRRPGDRLEGAGTVLTLLDVTEEGFRAEAVVAQGAPLFPRRLLVLEAGTGANDGAPIWTQMTAPYPAGAGTEANAE